MPKRFTDTEKWKKPFLRGLEGPYKLLWFYILDDCDHAGIWQVDFEVARIRIGEQVQYDIAVKLFGERVHQINKFKWFIPDFITFQYGELSEKNRLHLSVIQILSKYELRTLLAPSKPLPRGQGTIQGQDNGQGQGKKDEDMFSSIAEANKELTEDEQFIEDSVTTLSNRNWRAVTSTHVSALIFSFITTKSKYKEQSKSEVKYHFKNWLFIAPLETLISTSNTIIGNHERKQRSQA